MIFPPRADRINKFSSNSIKIRSAVFRMSRQGSSYTRGNFLLYLNLNLMTLTSVGSLR
jgi:hypothetical protein